MAISVKLKTNQKLVSKNYKRLATKLPRFIEQGLEKAGFHLLDIIRTKTSKGQDFRGKSWQDIAPYSRGYLKRLEREGKPTGIDLFYSGRMMGSLTPSSTVKKTGKNKISLAFNNAQMRQRALFNQVLGNPKREFFGFNSTTENIIGKAFNRFVEKQIKATGI
jgi:hypothetical protein